MRWSRQSIARAIFLLFLLHLTQAWPDDDNKKFNNETMQCTVGVGVNQKLAMICPMRTDVVIKMKSRVHDIKMTLAKHRDDDNPTQGMTGAKIRPFSPVGPESSRSPQRGWPIDECPPCPPGIKGQKGDLGPIG